MKWRKLGQIFEVDKHRLPRGCVGFAQSPQPVVFDNYIRVFFSTRSIDASRGKYISEVAYADFSPDFSEVLKVSDQPVITHGQLGTFDEHGIFPINVVRKDDELWGYTCGWSRRDSVPVETGIGLAISHDLGQNFHRLGPGPVLTASPQEPFLVGDGFVLQENNIFHMWYIFGTDWRSFVDKGPLERIYKIGHAVSNDGIQWEKPSEGQAIIPDRIGESESQALPCVINIDGVFHMFFCFRYSHDFRTNHSRSYRIGHATSLDLKSWSRDDDGISFETNAGSWDSDMACYPGICESKGRIYLLYNGNEFGRHGFGAAVLEK